MPLPSDFNQAIPPLSDQDHIRGSPSAPITLMKYGSYQCPQSRQAHVTIKEMQQTLSEQLCFVFRHFPRPQIYAQDFRAAESVEAAAVQGKFWEMHDILFEHQQALDDGDLVQYAVQLSLDIPQFLREMAEHTHVQRVQSDVDSGQSNGVEETPTFFIGVRCERTQNLKVLLMTILEVSTA
jgi:protein-disulfide isomerase